MFFAGLRRLVLRPVVAVLLAAASPAVWMAHAQTPPAGQYGAEAVQAVLLFNFIRFTEWPPAVLPASAPFVVGVSGNRALEDELLNLADLQKVRERRIRVIRVNSARDLSGCHVLYISSAPRPGEETAPGARELLPHVRGQPVLTVSDSTTFIEQGGIINLYLVEQGKQRFEIAPNTAASSGLTLSSRLLALARIVNPPEPEPAPAAR